MAEKNEPGLVTIPPIYNLNFDILWKIFWINTDIFAGTEESDFDSDGHYNKQARPLNTLRRTSQVCRRWREVVLLSPTLWGRVIELNLLGGDCHAHWRREVVARASQAPLHIVGTIRGEQSEFRLFFSELLDKHWSTICRLAVSVAANHRFKTETWGPLQRPAPLLKTFKLYFEQEAFPIFMNTNIPLFADSAPVLRQFEFRRSPKPQFTLQASWLRQLRTLTLSTSFNATELIDTLSNMQFLEYLDLENGISKPKDSDGQSRIVSLAFLQRLIINNTLRTSLFLLEHIIPSSRCALILKTEDRDRDDGFDTDIEEMCKQILRYTEGYLSADQILADSLGLRLDLGTIRFTAPTMSFIPLMDPHFSITIHVRSRLSPLTISRLLITFLDSRRYIHIKTFQLLASSLAHRYTSVVITEARLLDTFGIFFSSLSSVILLKTTYHGLGILLETQTRYQNTLPSLQTLEVREGIIDGHFKLFPELILHFLRRQVDRGRPITTLDISDCYKPEEKENLKWNILEDIKGLRVVWGSRGDEEYICGSGSPQNIGC